jgi:hypothetical protein
MDAARGSPPEIMRAIAGTDDRSIAFAALAQRVVGMTPSEAEIEHVISIPQDLVGTHGTRFGQDVFRSRTQLCQGETHPSKQCITFVTPSPDADETRFPRNFFNCCTSPRMPLQTAQKSGVMCIIPHHSDFIPNDVMPLCDMTDHNLSLPTIDIQSSNKKSDQMPALLFESLFPSS